LKERINSSAYRMIRLTSLRLMDASMTRSCRLMFLATFEGLAPIALLDKRGAIFAITHRLTTVPTASIAAPRGSE
jgi:hypothetical protein